MPTTWIFIHAPYQTYLGFSWTENRVTKYFCFTVVPFGLTSSPFIFTKLLRPLVKYWRLKGLLVVIYIDDGICISIGPNRTTRNAKFVRDALKRARLVANAEKCSWDPTHFAEWLGINVDTHKGIFYLSTRRIESLTSSIDEILTSLVHSSARKLSQVTGKIISMQPVLGNISRLMTRHLYMAIESRVSWDLEMDLSDFRLVQQESKFWKDNVTYLNCKNCSFLASQVSYRFQMQAKRVVHLFCPCIDGVISHRAAAEHCKSST